jgi:hypothetical protein
MPRKRTAPVAPPELTPLQRLLAQGAAMRARDNRARAKLAQSAKKGRAS